HHWNHAVVIAVAQLTSGILEQALGRLVAHHDSLRVRFSRNGRWSQRFALCETAERLVHVDLSHISAAHRAPLRRAASARCQASLDLTRGPLVRTIWFDDGAALEARVLLIAHHVVIDAVSW